jgi:hypothetical protein
MSSEFMKLSSNTRTPMKASFLQPYGYVQVAKSGGRQYDCVCGLHGQIVAKSHRNTVHWGNSKRCFETVSTCNFPILSHVCSQVLKVLLLSSEVMGQCGQTVAFQAGTYQETGTCPRAKQSVTNMDNGQRIWWVVAGRIKSLSNNTTFV